MAYVLFAEDDETLRTGLEAALSSEGYETCGCKDGNEALSAFTQRRPDLLILDVMMPEMDGYETLRQMKARNILGGTPVIFLTAKSDSKSEQTGLNLGAVDYIGKPFSPDLVLLRIKNQLEYKRQRDHLNELVIEKTQDLRNTLKVMLTSLGALAEYRDPETGGHIKRTQFVVQKLAEILMKNPKFAKDIPNREYVDYFATAAPLHDIGKVGIQDEILRKPGKLNEEERAIMREHATMGYNVLVDAAKGLEDKTMILIAADIAWCHHEYYDGNGYPRKLKGDEIPLCARIMAVADVYDALVSKRPYKEPLPHEVAVAEVLKGKGKQFDPDVVEAFAGIADSLPDLYQKFKDEGI